MVVVVLVIRVYETKASLPCKLGRAETKHRKIKETSQYFMWFIGVCKPLSRSIVGLAHKFNIFLGFHNLILSEFICLCKMCAQI